MAEDLREAIEGAFKELEEPSEPEQTAAEPVAESVAKDVVEPELAAEAAELGEQQPEKKEPPKPGEVKEPAKPEEVKEPPVSRARRAPGTWRPALREKWAALPPDVQSEILRREAEIARGFTESTNSRKFHEEFNKTVSPFQTLIAAEGGNAMQVVHNLMNTASAMYYGTPAQKVNMVAGFIKNFGVDLELLDGVLAANKPLDVNAGGGTPGHVSTLIQQEVQRHLAPILRGQQASQEEAQNQVASQLEAFASDPANEFFDDVRETMADLLEIAARRNQQMDLSTAYNRATMMHPDIAKVIEDRNLRKRAQEASATAQAARRKSVSVVGAPAKAAGEAKPETLRGDIEAAIAQAEGS